MHNFSFKYFYESKIFNTLPQQTRTNSRAEYNPVEMLIKLLLFSESAYVSDLCKRNIVKNMQETSTSQSNKCHNALIYVENV